MLEKLANIANSLDAAGMHADADVVTSVLTRVAHFFNHHKIDGPIEDFKPGVRSEAIDNSFEPSFFDSLSGDKSEIMKIHSTLRNMGVDPSGLDDQVARQIYQAIMAGQANIMHYASPNIKFKRLG